MALSWADARSKVRADLWKSATALPDDAVNRALHAALLAIESERRWLYLENLLLTTALVADADQINAPASCKSIDTLSLVTSGDKHVLKRDVLAAVRNLAVSSSGNWPEFYAFSQKKIYFDCTVLTGRQFEIVYKAATPELLDDAVAAADNPTLDLHQQAVIAHACFQLAGTRLKNRELAKTHFEVFDNHLSRMCDADDEARADLTGPTITPDLDYYYSAFGR